MSVDEKLWVLDKSETFALSGWLTQAETIRREINRLVFSHWDEVKKEQALSRSLLRRYIGYWHTHRELSEKEAMGVHGGTYAEDLVASVFRARIVRDCEENIQVFQNRWDKTVKREADICAVRDKQLLAVIEVKSALTREEWKRTRQTKEDYQKLPTPPSYWLLAIRADGLDPATKNVVADDASCCVLSAEGRKLFTLPEQGLEIWKPLEGWLDALIGSVLSDP
jgi:hypothetical protein